MVGGAKKKIASKRVTKKKAAKKTVGKAKAAGAGASELRVETGETAETRTVPATVWDLGRMLDEFETRWRHPFRDWPRWGELTRLMDQQMPSLDIVDKEKEVLVRAEVPGIDREDLDVSIAERTLTIKGASHKEEKEERDDYFRREIRSGSFSRSVQLPADVNVAKANATFKDGLLELHLPKVKASKRRKIALS